MITPTEDSTQWSQEIQSEEIKILKSILYVFIAVQQGDHGKIFKHKNIHEKSPYRKWNGNSNSGEKKDDVKFLRFKGELVPIVF